MRNPPAGCFSESAPGVEKRKESVVRKMTAPTAEPAADSVGATGRDAMARPVAISAVPMRLDVVWSPNAPSIQERNGLFSTSGRMASASKAKYFAAPITTSRKTIP
jgi:hypothetical protein